MAYGSTHTATIPTVSVTLGPAYATAVNAVLTEIRTTLNAKVTPAGVDVNADLTMRSGATRYGLTDIHRLTLYQQPSLLSAVTYPVALYSDVSGNLYYNNASSNQIQITSGSAVNGVPGNITGSGYGSAGVAVNWDAGASDYHMYSGAGTYADVNMAALQLSDGSSNFLRMAAAAMGADYTLTFPAAVPASTSVVQMSSAGALTASPSGAIATTGTVATGALTVTGAASTTTSMAVGTTLSVTGAADMSSTLVVTGLITANGGLTAGANDDITVSGSGQYKHGDYVRTVCAVAGYPAGGTPAVVGAGGYFSAAAAGDVVHIPIEMRPGERITAFTCYVNDSSALSFVRAQLFRMDLTTGGSTQVGDNADTTNANVGDFTLSDTTGIAEDVTATRAYYVRWTGGAAGDRVYGIGITYSCP